MSTATKTEEATKFDVEGTLKGVLGTIEREREREIISRRFGLYDRKETLEQIGELLGITRERVRQLEKVALTRLKTAATAKELKGVSEFEIVLLAELEGRGFVARISELAKHFTKDANKLDQARILFLSELAPAIAVIEESDHFYASAGVRKVNDEKKIREQVSKIIDAIKKIGEPCTIKQVAEAVKQEDTKHVAALASTSKNIAMLNNRWGLTKWPMVNPKNIRDKIYVILHDNGKHMHFNEIAAAIRASEFKRKDVTTQAIHNELIKDKRFVLIGRGIYALQEWGYKKGTVADMISEVLEDAGEPLHRDEIVKRVLKRRHVKETTILLNLQGKTQFKRVAKATYTLA
jgi:Sigma-70, region 4